MALPRPVFDETTVPRTTTCVVDGWRVTLCLRVEIGTQHGGANSYFLKIPEGVGGVVRYEWCDQLGNVFDSKPVKVTETGQAYVDLADGSRFTFGDDPDDDSGDDSGDDRADSGFNVCRNFGDDSSGGSGDE